LLNQAARYYPILRALKKRGVLKSESVLEIGAGPTGLGQFRKLRFIGCDVLFPTTPAWPMVPVIASAGALPFRDKSFSVVIISDVLEHIPADVRSTIIRESLRVTREFAVFGFPCGQTAQESDRKLFEVYTHKGYKPPIWLQEHLLAAFPEPSIFDDVKGWDITSFGNESIRFHSWMMRMEMHRLFNYFIKASILLVPRLLELLLRKMDSPPYYRHIFVLERAGE